VIVLGIDPGTACGWAVVRMPGYHVLAGGTWQIEQGRFEGAGMKFLRLRKWFHEVLEVEHPDLVAIEEIPNRSRMEGTAAAHLYGGITSVLHMACDEIGVDYCGIPVATWKRIATGTGNANKELAKIAAERHWPMATTWGQDQVDATWIAVTAAMELGGGDA
jgi:Holliday junction resolvasome RuvABC endonuclease subunit